MGSLEDLNDTSQGERLQRDGGLELADTATSFGGVIRRSEEQDKGKRGEHKRSAGSQTA
jgi:hypothetical protein